MFPRRLIFVGLAALLVIGLLMANNSAAQRDAWTQGYLVGRLSAGSAGTGNAAPLPPYAYPGAYPGYDGAWGYPGPHHGGFGAILLVGLGLLFFFGISRFFRGWHGGRPGEGPHGSWGMHGHGRRWWHDTPWPDAEGQEQPSQERPVSDEPRSSRPTGYA